MWTSLEVVKLLVSALTPIAVLGLGWFVSQSARRIENKQWVDRKVIERRLDLYDRMAPLLNDALCFFRMVGNFRETTPVGLIDVKRQLDRHFYVAKYLMSHEWRNEYSLFVDACFSTWNGQGMSATIRASSSHQKAERGDTWVEGWAQCFVDDPDAVTDVKEVRARYEGLMEAFSRDLGLDRERTALSRTWRLREGRSFSPGPSRTPRPRAPAPVTTTTG